MNDEIKLSFRNTITNTKSLEEYSKTLEKLNSILVGIDNGKLNQVAQATRSITKTRTETEKLNQQQQLMKKADTIINISALNQLMRSFGRVINTMSSMTRQSATFLENMNLLDVAFNNNTVEADKLVNRFSEMYGLDESWGYRTVGLFKQLSNAMGLTDEVGVKLSNTLSQLAVDLSSLYNVSTQEAVEKLTSALAGQTKPIKKSSGFTWKQVLKNFVNLCKKGVITIENFLFEQEMVHLCYC